jgi:arthrofactin-type cyclic lipopeptide synthetase C
MEVFTLKTSVRRTTVPPITPVKRSEYLPLSFAQQRLWFLAQIQGGKEAYNESFGVHLKGQLDRIALLQVLDRIVERHEALRTTFTLVAGKPMQRIVSVEESRFHLVEHDLRLDATRELEHLIVEEIRNGFDLERGPLIRGRLIRQGADEHILLITMHHIVSDGWSAGVLINEVGILYSAIARGEADPLPKLRLQYGDYAVWQRKLIEDDVVRQQGEYWRSALAGAPARLELPTDNPRPPQLDYTGDTLKVTVDERLTECLSSLSKRHGTTLYVTLLTGWAVLLGRISGQLDLVIGTPVANRGRPEIEDLIGFFANTLAMRLDLSGSPTISEMLDRVKTRTLAALQHQDIPFEQVVEIARPVRSSSHNPLFQVMFAWQNTPTRALILPGLEVCPLQDMPRAAAKFDMSLSLRPAGNAIVGELEYATALFERSTVKRYLGYFRRLLEAMVNSDTEAVDRLPLLPDEERQQLLYGWNDTTVEYPQDKCIQELFEEQVRKTPEAVAVVFEEASLSYAELNRRANGLAHYLRELGVRPDARVAICLRRGFEMIVALLAVLKAGGAYVPLDPAHPEERLLYMLEDSAPVAVLTQGDLEGLFAETAGALPVIDMTAAATAWKDQPETDPDRARVGLTPGHLAYVIYTSGSTGSPKGVMNEHRGICNRLVWMQCAYRLGFDDAVLQKTSFGFDVSVWEFFWPLLAGARLVVARPEGHKDPVYLCEAIQRNNITTIHFVPSMLHVFLKHANGEKCCSLVHVISSGEALPGHLARRFQELLPSAKLHNLYGPTEAAVDVTAWTCRPHISQGASIPIGRPIANTRIYILDGHRAPVPLGAAGELYIAGVGVARGYLNRPELTAERFVKDPFVADGEARMYKTGDLGRWLANGTIEFLGRNDLQVKIRGYRIELGEIETRLAECAGVREAVVTAQEDTMGDKRLIAYYTCADLNGPSVGAKELRAHLMQKLPEYMVPAAYVRLESLPLTANGKLDRNALSTTEAGGYGMREYEAPVGEIETALAEIWAELLKLEQVGRNDNFFELGGHSLLAVTVIERMRQIALQMDIRTLFATPKLAELAAAVGPQETVIEVPPNRIPEGCMVISPEMLPLVRLTAEEIERIVSKVPGGAANIQDIYPLAPLQEGILFHHLMGGEGDPYLLSTEFSFDSRARLNAYVKAMQAVVDRHDILRTAVVWEGLPEPVQVVWCKAVLPVEEVEIDPVVGDVAKQLYERFNPRRYGIDVRQAPLLRIYVTHDPVQQRWLMMLLRHHLTGDHSTQEIMQEEIAAHLLDQADRLPAPLPFRNLVAQARQGVRKEEHEAYFRQLIGDVEEPTAPFGLLDVQRDGTGIEDARLEVDAEVARLLRKHARKLGVSPASICHLAWAQVLARVAVRGDVVFGTVLLGRMQGGAGSDRAMGLFINTLPVRISIGDEGAEASVRRIHRQLAELLRHEHTQLAQAQRFSAVPTHTPLFSALLNYRHSKGGAQAQSEESKRAWEGIEALYAEERSNYPLTLNVDDLGEGFRLTVLVKASIKPMRVCEYMHTALASLVGALDTAPAKAVHSLEVLPEDERRQVLYGWNDTPV